MRLIDSPSGNNEIPFATPNLNDLWYFANRVTGKGFKNNVSALVALISGGASIPIKTFSAIADMLAGSTPANYLAFVNDASDDENVVDGWGLYMYNGTSNSDLVNYTLLAKENNDSLDLVIEEPYLSANVGDVMTIDGTGAYVLVSDPDTEHRIGVVSAVLLYGQYALTIQGRVKGLSGLTPGERYYAQADGSLGTTPTAMPVLIADTETSGHILNSASSVG